MMPTSERRSRWTTLLITLALTPLLGGGCTVFYSSDNDDDDKDDDDENSSTSAPADDGALTGIGTLAGVAGIDGVATKGTDAPPAVPGVTTLWNPDALVLMLTEMPDADGDGVGELGVLLIEAVLADSGAAGDIALAAQAFLLAGDDGRVLAQRSDGAGAGPPATLSVTPLHAGH